MDEKTGMQALSRRWPGSPPEPGRDGRFEFEYRRRGTRNLLAVFDPQTGEVFGRCTRRRTADDLVGFMDAVATRYCDEEVYVIWDNLNIHHGPRWEEFNERHGGRFHFVYTPIHASWVNQIEIWLGILHRRVLQHGSFSSAAELVRRVHGFIRHWNRCEAHPFHWTFRGTRSSMGARRAA
jgi:transposase